MIHGNSSDPVLIKKIKLKLWHLKDEIRATLEARLENNPGNGPISIEDLEQEYNKNSQPSDKSDSIEESTDMAAAMEENTDMNTELEESTDMAAAMGKDSNDQSDSIIQQRLPVLTTEKIINGTAVLAELGMEHLYLFTNKQFIAGQSIVIEFLVPKKFVLNAEILFSREYNMKSRIISDSKLPYRTGVKFTFLKKGERTLLRNFILSVEPVIPKTTKNSAKSAKKNNDSFDELDDFEL